MSLQTFFLESQVVADEAGETFELGLSEDDLRHFGVLRLRAGEHIAVVDASGDYFECEIASVGAGRPAVRVSGRRGRSALASEVVLFQGIPKLDKMDEIVRHATEVGASGFVPVAFRRCVPKLDAQKADKKRGRWQAIAKSAAMQSGRRSIPFVSAPTSLTEAFGMLAGFDRVVVFWEDADASAPGAEARAAGGALRSAIPLRSIVGEGAPARVAVVVGPEGGISPDEADALLASNAGASAASLGEDILRTETAGVVGCALVVYELGGLGGGGERRG